MNNPYRRPKGAPLVYGHRGARGLLPENTLESLHYLRSLGAQGVEIDVQNAAGRVPVVVHDPHVPMQFARDPAGHWLKMPGPLIHDLTLAELRAYDIGRLKPGHAYGARYPDQRPLDGARIPTLDDVLTWLRDVDEMILNIEIKSYASRDDLGDPPEILAMDVLTAVEAQGLAARVVVSSFDWRVLSALRAAAPHLARAYLSIEHSDEHQTIYPGSPWMGGLELSDFGGSLPELIAAQGACCWCPYYHDLTQARLQAAHQSGLAVNVWTVNSPDDLRRMIDLGVDGIITDRPDLALAQIRNAAPDCSSRPGAPPAHRGSGLP